MNLPSLQSDDTRERLLAAAGDEFARSGFAHASVRNICEHAGANVSAVKYHFGSKQDLYLAVWDIAAAHMVAADPMPTLTGSAEPQDALRHFIRWFMRLVLTESKNHPWAGQLLAHESVQSTPGAIDVFVKHCAGPICNQLTHIVSAIVGDDLDETTRDNLVFAVVALCVNPKHSRPILTALGNPPPDTTEGIDRMAGVMAEFALAGLTGFADRAGDRTSQQEID